MVLVGCGPSNLANPREVAREGGGTVPSAPKHLRAAVMSDPPLLSFKLNPISNVPGVDAIDDLVHVGLSTIDGNSAMQPRLAEAVPSLENGRWVLLPDGGMETTWHIRPNTFWHDGAPFTSRDLVFTVTIDQDRSLPTSRDFAYDLIERVEAPDDATIRVRWRQAFIEANTMFSQLRGSPLPHHLLADAYAEDRPTFSSSRTGAPSSSARARFACVSGCEAVTSSSRRTIGMFWGVRRSTRSRSASYPTQTRASPTSSPGRSM